MDPITNESKANITTAQIYNHALDWAKNGCGSAIAEAIFSEE